jgi:DNA-binding NarL/FixJ family response regulator
MVLRLMWEGMEYKQIAMAMNISVRLVEYQRLRLVTKLGATTSAHLMRRAIEEGMIQV